MKYGLTEQELKDIISIFNNYQSINEIILFGSRAMGNFNAGSDIDFAVIGNDINFNDLLNLNLELDIIKKSSPNFSRLSPIDCLHNTML